MGLHLALSTERSLDDWYIMVNRVYLDRNFYRDRFSIFTHLVEALGGVTIFSNGTRKPGVRQEDFVPKAIAWWMALCGKMGVRSVEKLVWMKFPCICPYCCVSPHDAIACEQKKANGNGPDWPVLMQNAKNNARKMPKSMAQWQQMFSEIYPVVSREDYLPTIAKITEEIGELAEAVRTSSVTPGYFLAEAADLFAWLMHLQNVIHSKRRLPKQSLGQDLAERFARAYPDGCLDCGNPVCTCPPILPGTLGRIAHELPSTHEYLAEDGVLLSAIEAQRLFELGARAVTIGGKEFEPSREVLREIRGIVCELQKLAMENRARSDDQSRELAQALRNVDRLTSSVRITQDSLDQLMRAIAALPEQRRNSIMSELLTSMEGSAIVAAVVEGVKALVGK